MNNDLNRYTLQTFLCALASSWVPLQSNNTHQNLLWMETHIFFSAVATSPVTGRRVLKSCCVAVNWACILDSIAFCCWLPKSLMKFINKYLNIFCKCYLLFLFLCGIHNMNNTMKSIQYFLKLCYPAVSHHKTYRMIERLLLEEKANHQEFSETHLHLVPH